MRTLVGVVLALVLIAFPAQAEVQDLIKRLSSKDNEIRRNAAKELGELGKDAKPAIKPLIKVLQDEDRFVRRFAAQALGSIGPEAKAAVPALAKLLNDDTPQVREAAVKALGKLGPTAVPALNQALTGTSDVQELAVTALGEVGKAGIPGLTRFIGDGKASPSLRRRAVELLASQGKEARGALSTLTQVARKPAAGGQEGQRLRIAAIMTVGKLATPMDKAAVSALEEIVNDEKLRNNQVKNAARKALQAVKKRN